MIRDDIYMKIDERKKELEEKIWKYQGELEAYVAVEELLEELDIKRH